MARLSAAQRRALKPSDFVFPEKAPGPCSLPIPDQDHASAALRLCIQCGPGACAEARRKIAAKFGDAEDRRDGGADESTEKS